MKTGISSLCLCMAVLVLCNNCTKLGTGKNSNCAEITSLKITGAKTVYYPGDTISLTTTTTPYAFYSWQQDSLPTILSKQPNMIIYPCTKYNEGWYYVTVSDPMYATHIDSVYIRVINKPAVAPCSPGNNMVAFSAIPDIRFGSASWAINPTWNCMNLKGYRALNYPDINIYFNPYWNTREPEDGAYDVSDTPGLPGNDVYNVYIASAYSGMHFAADPGKVYVSHANGKLQVSFCNLPMTGKFNGAFYTMTATGKLTAP